MNPDFGAACNRVLEALFNGVYQGLLVVGLVWLGLRLLPRSNASTRYAAGFAGMIIIACLPALHLGQAVWPRLSDWAEAGLAQLAAAYKQQQPAAELIPAEETAVSVESASEPLVFTTPETVESTKPERLALTTFEPAVEMPEVINEPPAKTSHAFAIPAKIAAALLCAWMIVSTFRLFRLARQCLLLFQIKRRASLPPEELRGRFEAVASEMSMRRKAVLGLSENMRTPVAAGFFKPMVLLPDRLWETEKPARLDGILRHELAHVRRWDDWTNLVQQIIEALFFFHPGVRWLSRRLTLEREIACDDHALASIPSRREYALLLAEFASRMQCREWAAAPGAWSKKGQLKERINMIMNGKRNASTRLARTSAGLLTVGAALVALLVMQAGPRLALADEPKGAASSVSASSSDSASETASVAVAVSTDEVTDPEVSANVSIDLVSPSGTAIATVTAPRQKERGGYIGSLPQPHPVPAAPAPPAAPAAGVLFAHEPHPAHPGHLDHPPKPRQPAQPRARAGNAPGDRDFERRLQRLERLVERLASDRGAKPRVDNHYAEKFDFKMPEIKVPDMHLRFDGKPSPEDMKRFQDEARRAGEHARKEAERVHKEVERMHRELRFDGKPEVTAELWTDKAPLQARRKALEKQRQALERQMNALERQIDEMEREEDRLEDQREKEEEERERQQEQREREQERKAEQEREREREKKNRDNPAEPKAESPEKRKSVAR